MKLISVAVCGIFLVACGPVENDSTEVEQTTGALELHNLVESHNLDVVFSACREFVGIGAVPAANARAVVPARYTLAGDATNAVIVVRAVDCGSTTLNGFKAPGSRVSQIGISITNGDPTADINNYLLWYSTDLALLDLKVELAGIDSEIDKNLSFKFTPTTGVGNGTLAVRSTPLRAPSYAANGPATVPTAAAVPFIATWWQDNRHETETMRTVFPAIKFGTANATLTTPKGSALARLIGGTSLTFPFLNSFNSFPTAKMAVREFEMED